MRLHFASWWILNFHIMLCMQFFHHYFLGYGTSLSAVAGCEMRLVLWSANSQHLVLFCNTECVRWLWPAVWLSCLQCSSDWPTVSCEVQGEDFDDHCVFIQCLLCNDQKMSIHWQKLNVLLEQTATPTFFFDLDMHVPALESTKVVHESHPCAAVNVKWLHDHYMYDHTCCRSTVLSLPHPKSKRLSPLMCDSEYKDRCMPER